MIALCTVVGLATLAVILGIAFIIADTCRWARRRRWFGLAVPDRAIVAGIAAATPAPGYRRITAR